MARLTGLEPATPGVTGRYSNQLSYNRPLNTPQTRDVARFYGARAGASSASVHVRRSFSANPARAL